MTDLLRRLRNRLFGTQFVSARYGNEVDVCVARQDALGGWYALILDIPVPLRGARQWCPLLGTEIGAYYLQQQHTAGRETPGGVSEGKERGAVG